MSRFSKLRPKHHARRVFDLAAGMPWAITPDYLHLILQIAARQNLSVEAVEAERGESLANTRDVTVRKGVAIVPVTGPIFRYASFFSRVSGATSIEDLALDLTTALNDPDVSSILLHVDSPGGEVKGTSELAQMVYEARGQKPITAYVDGLGCSAAYWIASACDRIIASNTAIVGSIGVIAAFEPDPEGEKPIEVISSQSPKKCPDPESRDGRAQIQATLDRLADVFIGDVARNRGVDAETVLANFGAGDVFVGADAVTAGLVDGLGSFEGVLEAVAAGEDPVPPMIPTPDDELPPLPDDDPITALTSHQESPAAPAATRHQPSDKPGSKRMRITEWLTGQAAAEGVTLDDGADFEAVLAGTDVEALRSAVAARDAQIAALQAAQERHDAELAKVAAEKREAEAMAYARSLVSSHRLVPAAAEPFAALVAHISAADTDPSAEDSPTATLKAFVATLPDFSAFTTERIKPEAAAALFNQETTPGMEGQKPSASRVADLIAMYPGGEDLASRVRANGTK